jgi:hypothetical protein
MGEQHSGLAKRALSMLVAGALPIIPGGTGIFGEGIIGQSSNSVILVNATGLKVVKVMIGDKAYEDIANKADKIFISVTPKRHHMELFFRGGVHIDWQNFDFRDVHQIVFDLVGNRVSAHPK